MRVTVYVHASKDSMYETGEQMGLTGDALRMFSFACSEVEVELEVTDDGKATIMKVDGRDVANLPNQFGS